MNSLDIAGNSPQNMLSVLSFLELGHGFTLYTRLRHVDELPSLDVPSYDAVDASVGGARTIGCGLSLTVAEPERRRAHRVRRRQSIERSVFARFDWRL